MMWSLKRDFLSYYTDEVRIFSSDYKLKYNVNFNQITKYVNYIFYKVLYIEYSFTKFYTTFNEPKSHDVRVGHFYTKLFWIYTT